MLPGYGLGPKQPTFQMPSFTPGSSYDPGHSFSGTNNFNMPPMQQMVQGFERMTAPIGSGGGLMDRAAGALDTAFGGLGYVTQQIPSEILSGGERHMPSDFLPGSLRENSFAQFATNLVADPFTIAMGVPSILALSKGWKEARAGQFLNGIQKPLEEILLDAKGHRANMLMFHNQEQGLKALRESKLSLPLVQHETMKTWHPIWSQADNPRAARLQLKSYLESQGAYLYDKQAEVRAPLLANGKNPREWEPYSVKMNQPWDMTEAGHFKERAWITKFVGANSDWSPNLKAQVRAYDDAHVAFAAHAENMNDIVKMHTHDFDFWEGSKSPKNRAWLYKLYGDQKALEKDKDAFEAFKFHEKRINESTNAVRSMLFDELKGIDHSKIKRKFDISDLNGLRKDGIVPENMRQWLTGARRNNDGIWEGGIALWRGDNLETHAANPVSHLLSIQRRLGKERIMKPIEKAIVRAREEAYNKGKGLMGMREYDFSNAVSRAFIGDTTHMLSGLDKEINKVIINNKDSMQALRLNALLTSAERGESLTNKAVQAGTKMTYKALLGFGLDSAIKNVFGGTFNTLAEYGFKALESVAPTIKGMTDKRWAERVGLDKVFTHSNNFMDEAFRKTKFEADATFLQKFGRNPFKTLSDYAMHPMHITENFNRGLAYMTALNHNLKVGGMTVMEAMDNARDMAKKLHFGYASTDVSPFLNNPLAKAALQFKIYPSRQIGLVMKWVKEGKGLQNKALKYAIMSGAMIAQGGRHGLDMSQVLGVGLGFSEYPGYLRFQGGGILPDFTATPPLLKLAQTGYTGAKNLIDAMSITTTGEPLIDQDFNSKEAWDNFGDFLRLTIPGGRYISKVSKQYVESALQQNPQWSNTESWGGKANPLNWADIASLTGAKYDPARMNTDSLLRVLGFAPTSDREKYQQMQGLGAFVKSYRRAIGEINEYVLAGRETDEIQEKWQRRIVNQHSAWLSRAGVDADTLRSMIRPSEMSYLKRAMNNQYSSGAEQMIRSLPARLRDSITL